MCSSVCVDMFNEIPLDAMWTLISRSAYHISHIEIWNYSPIPISYQIRRSIQFPSGNPAHFKSNRVSRSIYLLFCGNWKSVLFPFRSKKKLLLVQSYTFQIMAYPASSYPHPPQYEYNQPQQPVILEQPGWQLILFLFRNLSSGPKCVVFSVSV